MKNEEGEKIGPIITDKNYYWGFRIRGRKVRGGPGGKVGQRAIFNQEFDERSRRGGVTLQGQKRRGWESKTKRKIYKVEGETKVSMSPQEVQWGQGDG